MYYSVVLNIAWDVLRNVSGRPHIVVYRAPTALLEKKNTTIKPTHQQVNKTTRHNNQQRETMT